jgi:hypothetical protein
MAVVVGECNLIDGQERTGLGVRKRCCRNKRAQGGGGLGLGGLFPRQAAKKFWEAMPQHYGAA